MFSQLVSGAKSTSKQKQQPNVGTTTKQTSSSAWSFLAPRATKDDPKSAGKSSDTKKSKKKAQVEQQQQQQARKTSNSSSHTPTVSSSSGYNSVGAPRQAANGSSASASSSRSSNGRHHYATATGDAGPTLRLAPAHYAVQRHSANHNVRSFQHRSAAELDASGAGVQLDPSGNQQQSQHHRPPRYLMQVAAPMVPVMIDDDDDNLRQLDQRRHRAKLMIDGQLSSLGDENDDDDEVDVSVDDDDDETADLVAAANSDASIGRQQHFYHSHGIDDQAIAARLQQLRSRRQKISSRQQQQKSWVVGQQNQVLYQLSHQQQQQRPIDYYGEQQIDSIQSELYQPTVGLSSLNYFHANKSQPATSRQHPAKQSYQSIGTSFSYHQPAANRQLIYDDTSQFQAHSFAISSGSKSLGQLNHNCSHSRPTELQRRQLFAQEPPTDSMQAAANHLASRQQHQWNASSSSPDLHHQQQHHHHQRENSSKRKSGHTNTAGLATPIKQHYLVQNSQSSSNIRLLQKPPPPQQMPPPNSFPDPNVPPLRTGARGALVDSSPPLSCCGRLAKFLLFISNVLFWSAGLALGAWGILALIEDHKYNLSQLLVFEPNTRLSLFQLLSWSFITLGCAAILVGFCGCSAIFKNNRWILGLFIFLILAIFALDLATGLLAIIFQERLVANIRLRLVNKLRNEYGVQASFTAAIDYIQTKYECCGLDGHLDYDQSLWRLQRLGGFEATVARTCCHLRNTLDDQAHVNPRPVNESMCQSSDVRFHQSYRYRRGCLDDLERLIRHKIWTFTIGCGAVGAVILVSLLFATCFCRSIPNAQGGSRKGSAAHQHQARNNLRAPMVLSYVDKNDKKQHFSSHYR